MRGGAVLKPLFWMGSSHADLIEFPEPVKDAVGYALYVAQAGERHFDVEPLRGLGGAAVLEVVTNAYGNAFRAIYTVRFAEAIYVLHAFEKTSTHGIRTPRREMLIVHERLKQAERHHAQFPT